MRRLALPAVLLCALAACGDDAAPVTATAPPTDATPGAVLNAYGLNERYGAIIDGASGPQLDTLLNRSVDLGVGWVKYTFRWFVLQPSGPSFDPAALASARTMVAAARQRGLKVYVLLEGVPGWTRRCGEPGTMYNAIPLSDCQYDVRYPPDDYMYNTVQWYVSALAGTHFKTWPYDVQAWGILNEPNSDSFFRVVPGRDPATEYRTMLAYMSNELRAHGHFVVGPELAQGGSWGYADFLARVLQHGQHHLDAVGVHQYNSADGSRADMGRFLDTIARYAPGKPLWLTETGATYHSALDEAQQSQHLAGQLDEMENGGPDWQKSFYFRLQGPISPDLPYSWLIDSGTYAVRQQPYDCLKWYAKGRDYGWTRPLNCVRTPGR
jgi:hypothetical protein